MSSFTKIYIWLAWISIGLALLIVIFLMLDIGIFQAGDITTVPKSIFLLMKNNPGDFSWGTVGILLTFGSVLLMVATFSSQKSQFKEQFTSEKLARFENTFYNLLSMFYNVRNETNRTIESNIVSRAIASEWKESKDLEGVAKYLLKNFKVDSELQNEVEKLSNDISDSSHTLKQLKSVYGKNFSTFILDIGNPTSYYFRYLSNLIDYVIDYWKGDDEIIKKYLNFIQAQMSDAELCLMFYNCLSGLSKNSEYNFHLFQNINKYNFLQNIPEEWMDNISNHLFYNSTSFRYLSRSEKDKKIIPIKETVN